MLHDSRDEIRALGFVALHSAYLEVRIHELLIALASVESYQEEHHVWPIDRKIKAARQRLRILDEYQFAELRNSLKMVKECFVKRNEVMHSAIYSGRYKSENLVSTRPGVPPRPIDSEEIYSLAERLTELDCNIAKSMISEIPRAVARFQASKV